MYYTCIVKIQKKKINIFCMRENGRRRGCRVESPIQIGLTCLEVTFGHFS